MAGVMLDSCMVELDQPMWPRKTVPHEACSSFLECVFAQMCGLFTLTLCKLTYVSIDLLASECIFKDHLFASRELLTCNSILNPLGAS
jgi:hypothetical protein